MRYSLGLKLPGSLVTIELNRQDAAEAAVLWHRACSCFAPVVVEHMNSLRRVVLVQEQVLART